MMEHFSNSSGHFDGFFGCYYLKVNFRIRKKNVFERKLTPPIIINLDRNIVIINFPAP